MDEENQEIASNEIQENAGSEPASEGLDTPAGQENSKPAEGGEEDLLAKIAKGQEAAAKAAEVPGAQADPANPAAVPAAQTWQPNFKIKAFKKEYEIPEMYRGLVKDAETEKQLRDIFTKFHSFDDTRAMYDNTRKERDEVVQKFMPMQSQLQKAASVYGEAVKPGGNIHQMDQVLEILGLQEEHIMQYAIEKAKLAQMDPAQRDLIQGKLQAERQAQTYMEQQQQFQGQLAQQKIELKQQEFALTMAQPQVNQLAEAFQSKFGMDFQDEVVAAGEYAYAVEGRNISVAEAVQRVVKRYNLEANQAGGNTQSAAATPANQGAAPARVPVRTLPNIKANNGSSPVGKPKVSSLDDLKKLRDQAHSS